MDGTPAPYGVNQVVTGGPVNSDFSQLESPVVGGLPQWTWWSSGTGQVHPASPGQVPRRRWSFPLDLVGPEPRLDGTPDGTVR